MSYLVTVCDGCQTVALAAVAGFRAQPRACEGCEHPLRVVPSRMFQEDERTLFEELSVAISDGCLSSGEAHALNRLVTRAVAEGTYTACWEVLTNRLPALLSRQFVLGGNPCANEKALQLVRTILDAVSTTRRSGTMPALGVDVPHKQQA